MKNDFNEFRFNGLDYRKKSNKYFTMKRVSNDESKIVVKMADDQVRETKYGYMLIIDDKHVVFLKNWQVSKNYYGTEVLLNKEYFIIKEFGNFPEYMGNEENFDFNRWVEVAKSQDNLQDEDGFKINQVQWLI